MDQKLDMGGELEGRGLVSYRKNYMCAIGGRFTTYFMTFANFEALF